MNNKQFIPRVTSEMIKKYPEQMAEVLNRIIDKINQM
jgi:hypothetical protein